MMFSFCIYLFVTFSSVTSAFQWRSLPTNLKKGLSVHYLLDNDVKDSVIHPDGIQHNAKQGSNINFSSDRFGKENGATLVSENGHGHIEIPLECISNVDDFTLSFWMKPLLDGLKTHKKFDFIFTQGRELRLFHYMNNTYGFDRNATDETNNCKARTEPLQFPPMEWSMMTLVRQESETILYKNNGLGENKKSNVCGGKTLLNPKKNFILGGIDLNSDPPKNVGGYFFGQIDDVYIWNRALSSKEVNQLYEYESWRDISLSSLLLCVVFVLISIVLFIMYFKDPTLPHPGPMIVPTSVIVHHPQDESANGPPVNYDTFAVA